MLTKLLKYEFKSTYIRYLSAFAVYAVIAGALMLFFRANVALTITATTLGLIALWVMIFVTIFQRYNGNLYGSEGYLMFTLPVSSRRLLLSKVISALVWMLVLGIISVVYGFLIALCYANIPDLGRVFHEIGANFYKFIPYLVEYGLSAVFALLTIFFAITVSKLPLWRKFGVLVGFVTYFVLDFIQSIPSLILAQVKLGMTVENNTINILEPSTIIPDSYIWVQSGYLVILCVAVFFACSYLMEHKTTLK